MSSGDVSKLFPLVTHEQELGLFDQLHDRLVGLPERPEILQGTGNSRRLHADGVGCRLGGA